MNALRRLTSGVRASTTSNDDAFSSFHRTLSRSLYMTDLDAVEYRIEGGRVRIVAILELKAAHVTDPDHVINSTTQVKLAIAQALGVPFLHVWHDFAADPPRFRIWNVSRSGLVCDYLDRVVEFTGDEFEILLTKL